VKLTWVGVVSSLLSEKWLVAKGFRVLKRN
jgi:hypothetical protein